MITPLLFYKNVYFNLMMRSNGDRIQIILNINSRHTVNMEHIYSMMNELSTTVWIQDYVVKWHLSLI